MKKQVSFSAFMASVVADLQADERWSTARVYAAALGGVLAFAGGEVFFSALTPGWLKRFEDYLRLRQLEWNTVSTYLRMVRATYNRGVDRGLVSAAPRLFSGVETGVKREQKRSLAPRVMNLLVYAPACEALTEEVAESREWLRLMFELQGMPFVDLAHLHHSDYDAGKRLLTCRRQKTGTPLSISLSAGMVKWIEQRRNHDRESSPYLLNILSGKLMGEEAYREYQRKLQQLNRHLKRLARIQGISERISSYTSRHTWATLAKHCRIPEGMICDALGHTSVKTTETYLKSFDDDSLRRANSKVIACVQRAVTS